MLLHFKVLSYLGFASVSSYNGYHSRHIGFQHTEIIEQIDRDLQRTHPDLKFFSGDSSSSKKKRVSVLLPTLALSVFFL